MGGAGGTNDARYCYSVWLRHLVLAHQKNLWHNPKCIVELGPGGSLGTGLSALLSGVNKYYALDAIKFSNIEQNLIIFDKLVNLFEQKEDIPDNCEFPDVHPVLDNYSFPNYILTDKLLEISLNPLRINSIRHQISNLNNQSENENIFYIVPWNNSDLIERGSIDMIFSQAVLEHINDLDIAYRNMFDWLTPDGFISHQIDFKSHRPTIHWNDQWIHSEVYMKLIESCQKYSINRWPHSYHIDLIKKTGFNLITDNKTITELHSVSRMDLSNKFKNIVTDEDLRISDTFVQCVKPK
jgi:SAM-dependent methyltransferase